MVDKSLCFYWELEDRLSIISKYRTTLFDLANSIKGPEYERIRFDVNIQTSKIKELISATYIEPYIIRKSWFLVQNPQRIPKIEADYTQDFPSFLETNEEQLARDCIDFYERLIGYLQSEIKKRKDIFSFFKTLIVRIIFYLLRWPIFFSHFILVSLIGSTKQNEGLLAKIIQVVGYLTSFVIALRQAGLWDNFIIFIEPLLKIVKIK